MQFSPLPYHLVPLRPKYSPQHPVLKHPQPTFPLHTFSLQFPNRIFIWYVGK